MDVDPLPSHRGTGAVTVRRRRLLVIGVGVVALVVSGCGSSSRSSAQLGCERSLDGAIAAVLAHHDASLLAAARAEAKTWAALSPQRRRSDIAACVSRGGAPKLGVP